MEASAAVAHCAVNRIVCLEDSSKREKTSGLGFRFFSWLLLIAFSRASAVTSSTLSVPSTYTAFEGDLPVRYSISEPLTNNELIEIVRLDDNHVVASTVIPRNFSEAELTFDCGALDTAGQYAVRLLDRPNGSVIAEGGVTRVLWPRVTLALPAERTILSEDVTLTSSVDDALRCESARRDTAYELVLVFRGANESHSGNGSKEKTLSEREVEVESRVLGTISMVERTSVTFRCNLFDQVGVYRVILRSKNNRGNPVAVSNELVVNDINSYSLTLHQRTIFPCFHHVIVNYFQPKCSSQDDKIRLYRLVRAQSGGSETTIALHKLSLDYVIERRIIHQPFSFACASFNVSDVGYCFRYGAVIRNGNTVESAISCLATINTSADRIVAEWNSWSEWSRCLGDCRSGTRQRVRSCNDPYPGITECIGPKQENSSCKSTCLEAYESWTMAPQCQCGCTLTDPQGVIMTSSKCNSLSTWLISAPQGQLVRLEFRVFELNAHNQMTWVRIRDGERGVQTSLLRTSGGILPLATTTTQNRMLIEYMGPIERRKDEYGQEEYEGFVANYTTFEDRRHFVEDAALRKETGKKQAVWESAVTVIGSVLSVIVVLATVVFVCHRQMACRCPSGKLTQTPVHEALLGRAATDAPNQTASFPDAVLPLEGNGSTTANKVRSSHRPSSRVEVNGQSSVSSACSDDDLLSGSERNTTQEQTYPGQATLLARAEASDAKALQKLTAVTKSSKRGHRKSRNEGTWENFPLELYSNKYASSEDGSCLPEKRPPVEGRDAPPMQKSSLEDFSRIDSPTAPEMQVGDFVRLSKPSSAGTQDKTRNRGRDVNLQGLELDDLSRVKMNPEDRGVVELMTPQSDASSVVLPLRDPANQDSDFITNDEFEYDDYIPELPGSYFTMDRPEYTLTWSKHHI